MERSSNGSIQIELKSEVVRFLSDSYQKHPFHR